MEKRWVWWKILLYIWAFACPIAVCVFVFNQPLKYGADVILRILVIAALLIDCAGLIFGIVTKTSIWFFIIPYAGLALGVLLIKAFGDDAKYEEERSQHTVRCKQCGQGFVAFHNNSCKICGSFDIVYSVDMHQQVYCKRCNSYRPGTYRCPHCGTDQYQ